MLRPITKKILWLAFVSLLSLLSVAVSITGCSEDETPDKKVSSALYGIGGTSDEIFVAGMSNADPIGNAFSGTDWLTYPFDESVFWEDWRAWDDNSFFTSLWMYVIVGDRTNGLFAAGSWGMIYRLVDGIWVTAWRGMKNPDIWGDGIAKWWDACTSGDKVYFCGGNGLLMVHDGATWDLVETGVIGNFNSIWSESVDNIYAVSPGGVVHYDGDEWRLMDELPVEPFVGVAGTAADNVFISSSSGKIVRFDGDKWNTEYENPEGWALRVYCLPDSTTYALSLAGDRKSRILSREADWTPVFELPNAVIYDMWGRNKSDIYVVGYTTKDGHTEDGIVYYFDGQTWERIQTISAKDSGVKETSSIVGPVVPMVSVPGWP